MTLFIIIIMTAVVSAISILIIDAVQAMLTGESKLWFRRHICDEFPHNPKCFDCNKGDCKECEIKSKII